MWGYLFTHAQEETLAVSAKEGEEGMVEGGRAGQIYDSALPLGKNLRHRPNSSTSPPFSSLFHLDTFPVRKVDQNIGSGSSTLHTFTDMYIGAILVFHANGRTKLIVWRHGTMAK